MKKKHHHRSAKQKHRGPRNAATGFPASAPRPRARSIVRRSAAPSWKAIAAAVAGGAGSAALGGLVVNQQILSPETVGIGLILGGGATAYFSEGIPRIVGTSVAASGAGQLALAFMNKRALDAHGAANANKGNDNGSAASPAPTTPAQLPPPPAVRRSPDGGGFVTDLFRDAANDLEMVEDEWRYGIRDDAYANNEPIVIDLDEAA
jgi:hypothetical protein